MNARGVCVVSLFVTVLAGCPSEPTQVAAPAKAVKPFGWLDEPGAGQVTGRIKVYGWALSPQGKVTKIEILVDGVPVPANIHRVQRGNICTKYPGLEDCEKPGFTGEADFSGVVKGTHTLSARFTDTRNVVVELARRSIVVE